jgi:hypothetical protein
MLTRTIYQANKTIDDGTLWIHHESPTEMKTIKKLFSNDRWTKLPFQSSLIWNMNVTDTLKLNDIWVAL